MFVIDEIFAANCKSAPGPEIIQLNIIEIDKMYYNSGIRY